MPPPPTPVKRPTLGLKRDSSYIDTDDEAGLSSSTKKLKVAFSPTVDVRIMDDWSDKSSDLVKEEVRQAIERHIAPIEPRDDAQYAKLLQLLGHNVSSGEAPNTKLLKKYILAIYQRVRLLGQCEKLVVAVLDLSWLGREEAFVGLYSTFLCDLASAHTKYIPAIIERLVSHFVKLPASLGRLPEETPIPRAKMFSRLHSVIKALLRQIPSASNVLMRVLKLDYPNDLATTKSYLQYQKHLLRLADEAPELASPILALIVQRVVALDVQIQQDLEDFEEEAEDRLLQRPRSDDGDGVTEDTDDSDIESVSESEETITEEEQRMRDLRLKVAKMDGTLDLLFEYYTPLVGDGSKPETNDAYQQILSHFETFVLPNRCRHSQFLLFHFSQVSPAHASMFTQRCMSLAFRGPNPKVRLTACAYLSSFLARGAHIPSMCVQDNVAGLCSYLETMGRRYGTECRIPDRQRYSMYYAVAQAMLYVFCFRWRDLVTGPSTPEPDSEGFDNADDAVAEGRDLSWQIGFKETLTQGIYSRLNPLKVCSPTIVGEFAKIANHLRFLYVYPLLETNKRLRLGQTLS